MKQEWSIDDTLHRSGEVLFFKIYSVVMAGLLCSVATTGTAAGCLSCNKEIPDKSLATGFLHHIAKNTGQLPRTAAQHTSLIHKILMITAWGQLLGAAGGASGALLCCVLWCRIRRRRHRRPKEDSD